MGEVIGVVGAGVMGRGIVQLFAQAGHTVRLYDADAAAAGAARSFVLGMLDRQVAKGGLTQAGRDAAARRVAVCDNIAGLSGCTIIIEAIVERLDVKQTLFAQLEAVLDATTILASNTSSLLISAIAARCSHPERIAGLHFFNPVPLMRIAEVISGIRTDPATAARLTALIEAAGHRAVAATDQPGFLINHAGRALYTEGLRIVEESVTDFAGVDRIMREGLGFRMGPFELLDLTGLDVSAAVMQSIYEQFQHDPRYRPSALVPPRLAAGLFGRKTGRGFYGYAGGDRKEAGESSAPDARRSAWIAEGGRQAELNALAASAGFETVASPDDASRPMLLLSPWGDDVTSTAMRMRLDPERALAVDPLPDFARRRTLMTSPVTLPEVRDAAHALLAADGVTTTVIADSAGFVAQRVAAMIVNTGCEIAQRAIAIPADIDAAVRIGLGYPAGPLELGDRIGARRVLGILERLQSATGDPRYRASQWLRRRAALGRSLTWAAT